MAPPPADDTILIHASTVALNGRAVLIRGASGRGKSVLALQLIALGAKLVADDQTLLTRTGKGLIAQAPAPITGLIEARGAGLLRLPPVEAPLRLVVDLDLEPAERLPEPEVCAILGVNLPLLRRIDGPHLSATVFGALGFGPPCLPPNQMPSNLDPDPPRKFTAQQRLVFVTGPSGAGRSTAIAVLEDLGFETIDNLPLSLLPRLFSDQPPPRPLALGVDVRNRDFDTDTFLALLDDLAAQPDLRTEALYLDARPDILSRRYSETRRRHPLAPGETPEQGIKRETEVLTPLRARADVLIETSEMTPHDLRAELERLYGGDSAPGLSVSVQSFSFKRGLPRGLDTVFDVRFLSNPHWQPHLRSLTGLDPAVADHVAEDPRYGAFFDKLRDLLLFLLPAYADEGKTHFAIGIGCTGGKHRSVALAEALSQALRAQDWAVSTRHREIERHAGAAERGAL